MPIDAWTEKRPSDDDDDCMAATKRLRPYTTIFIRVGAPRHRSLSPRRIGEEVVPVDCTPRHGISTRLVGIKKTYIYIVYTCKYIPDPVYIAMLYMRDSRWNYVIIVVVVVTVVAGRLTDCVRRRAVFPLSHILPPSPQSYLHDCKHSTTACGIDTSQSV